MRTYRDFAHAWKDQGRNVLIAAAVAGVLTALVVMVLPKSYRARATVILPQNDGAQNPILTALTATASPLEVLRGVCDSHAARVMISDTTGKSMKDLKKDYDVRTSPDEQQIMFSCSDKSKEKAKLALATAIDALSKLYDKSSTSVESSKATELKKVINAREKELREAEAELLDVSKKTGVGLDPTNPYAVTGSIQKFEENEILIDSLTKQIDKLKELAIQRAIPGVNSETGLADVEEYRKQYAKDLADYQVAAKTFGPAAPQLAHAKAQADASKRALEDIVVDNVNAATQGRLPELADLQAKLYVAKTDRDRLLQLAQSAPQNAEIVAQLFRRVTALGAALTELSKQYEVAHTQLDTSAINWSVLEQPYIDEDDQGSGASAFGALAAIFVVVAGCAFLYYRVELPEIDGLSEE